MSDWQPPEVVVVALRSEGSISYVELLLPAGLTPPLAPSSLWAGGKCLVDLDQVVKVDGGTTSFRSSGAVQSELVGQKLGFQQWWTQDQLALVTDTMRRWTRATEAPSTCADFCQLGWEGTETEQGPEAGWVSGIDWICDRCHETYIVRDRLGVREERG